MRRMAGVWGQDALSHTASLSVHSHNGFFFQYFFFFLSPQHLLMYFTLANCHKDTAVDFRWNLWPQEWLCQGCLRKLKHGGVPGCWGSQGKAASMGSEATEHVQFTFHHILLEDMYFRSRKRSCYYKMKIHTPRGLFLALLQGCALRSRAVVKQQGTRSDSPWDPAGASKPRSSCFPYSIQMAFVRLPSSADMSCLAGLCEERAGPDGTQHCHSSGQLLPAQTHLSPQRGKTVGKEIKKGSIFQGDKWKQYVL